MLRTRQRTLAAVAAGLLLATLVVTATPGAADAATCSGTSENLVEPIGTADFTWAICSDSSIQIWNGTIHDTLCDNRAAEVEFEILFKTATGNGFQLLTVSSTYRTDNGCGTSSSFPHLTFGPNMSGDCSTCVHQLKVKVVACSNNLFEPCSTNYFTDFDFGYGPGGGAGGCGIPQRMTVADIRSQTPLPC
jgi:hypothetical protein